jgi:acyl carrier protein
LASAAGLLAAGADTLTLDQPWMRPTMSSLKFIQDLMVEKFDLNPEDLKPDATLESLGLDSLSVIEFTFDLEDKLNIRMPEERLQLITLQDVVNLIDNLVADQKSHPESISGNP